MLRRLLSRDGMLSRKHDANVFEWLDEVRERPGLYLVTGTLGELETLVRGYDLALGEHCLLEGVPTMGRHFSSWLRLRERWSLSCGWAKAIEQRTKPGQSPLELFFRLVDKYRRLRPVVLCHAKLGPQHIPTGRRCVIGFSGRLMAPQQIDIVQYHPEPLHFLRSHYAEGAVDEDMLYTSQGSVATTEGDARRWAEDEFQLSPKEWVTSTWKTTIGVSSS